MSAENFSKRALAIKNMIDSNNQASFAWFERTTDKIGFIYPASITLGEPFTAKNRVFLKNPDKYKLSGSYVYTVVESATKTQLDVAGYAGRVPMLKRGQAEVAADAGLSVAASSTAADPDAYQSAAVIVSVQKQFSRVAGNHAATFQAEEEKNSLLADPQASSANAEADSAPAKCCTLL